ncbi:nucleotide exchange factor GrpE [Candidatus Microgenomates bacterium]|nr:nucleotide exchange factor GrpE [Candidatus Microgenomates bacterium]
MKKDKPVDEFKEKYLRALADYQNLEKQTESWKTEFAQFSNLGLIRKLLEVLDDLEKAQEHLQDEGLNLIIGKLHNILREEGLEEIDVLGKPFDPITAEVISTEPGQEEHKVIKVLQKGYKLKEKVIRPAKVTVWAKLLE